jgi:hypothetical protein
MANKTKPPPASDDRRIQKTKKYLADALKQLILEKGYDAVTIQDIIDRANVGRSTFYMHYENKDQLLTGNIHFQENLIHTPVTDYENYPMGINLSYLFNHTKENLQICNAMSDKGIEVLSAHFADSMATKIVNYHQPRVAKNKIAQKILRYKAEAVAGGIVRMLFKWLQDGAVVPVDEMLLYGRKILDTCTVEN